MDVLTYTGDGSALRLIGGLAFAPDLVWIKGRNQNYSHNLFDSVRGVEKVLTSNTTSADNFYLGNPGDLTAFGTNGFTIRQTTNYELNHLSDTYVAWCWKAGGTAVANTDGTIPSQVSANPTAGFSIITYTGSGVSGATVGHGLWAAPKFVIVKRRNGVGNWVCWHINLANNTILLNSTETQSQTDAWVPDPMTASAVKLGASTQQSTNISGATYVAYCWAEIPGFSKFGSYTGNGSSDGPFVHCGFRPRWVLVKVTDAANDWTLLDSGRSPENPVDEVVYANLPNSEVVNGSHKIDFLANGFKIRSTDSYATINGSGHTYIYAAFAEYPFGGAKTTPAKAR
ncbi:MAG: hypothetical protein BGO92_02990 [Magnetospirillum sp. 64-120]|nr:MAG: hypothetical protein BGO92_02990 [Magnetospirillum sp. 64-120]